MPLPGGRHPVLAKRVMLALRTLRPLLHLQPLMRRILAGSALLAVALTGTQATATIVERVVAVVGDQPILLSELRGRTKPFEAQMGGAPADRAAQRSQLFSQMLERIVDEELMRRAASQAKVTVTDAEVDAAVERVARGNNVSAEELLVEVERSGVSRTQYKRELRGQLLDAKVMNTRAQGRVNVSPDEVRVAYQEFVADERKALPVQLAVIRLPVPTLAAPNEKRRIEDLAKTLVQQARAGASFEEMSRQYGATQTGRPGDGLLPRVAPAQMPPELAIAVLPLEPGQVAAPVWSDNTWLIIKLLERAPSSLPSFEEAEMQVMQRVQMQKLEKVRRRWLDDMRKRTHVEIRL
jgi:peptidyl-prolyl cis-trans isomerase SurA